MLSWILERKSHLYLNFLLISFNSQFLLLWTTFQLFSPKSYLLIPTEWQSLGSWGERTEANSKTYQQIPHILLSLCFLFFLSYILTHVSDSIQPFATSLLQISHWSSSFLSATLICNVGSTMNFQTQYIKAVTPLLPRTSATLVLITYL